MNIDETALTEILKDLLEQGGQTQKTIDSLGAKIAEKDKTIEKLVKDYIQLIASFEHKNDNIVVKAPQPDLSEVSYMIKKGMHSVTEMIEKGPKPVVRQFRLTLFPEQVRSPEYYRVMMGWLVWIILGSLFLVLTYLLLNKHL